MKNQETDHFFLNDEHEIPESRVVIEKGVVWQYNKTGEQEALHSDGPLKYGVILMVSPKKDRCNTANGSERPRRANLLLSLLLRSVLTWTPR